MAVSRHVPRYGYGVYWPGLGRVQGTKDETLMNAVRTQHRAQRCARGSQQKGYSASRMNARFGPF